jgi:hypothetical protein
VNRLSSVCHNVSLEAARRIMIKRFIRRHGRLQGRRKRKIINSVATYFFELMKTNLFWIKTCFGRAAKVAVVVPAVIAMGMASQVKATELFWDTSGATGNTWTSSKWGTSASGPFTSPWTAAANATFTANSTNTFATATVGNVTVSANQTVTVTAGGTLTLGGVRTFDIGSGATLAWTGQAQSTAAGNEGAGIIKNSAGTLNWGAGPGTNVRFDGGFTLNAGTIIVSGKSSFGTGMMAINGGTLQSSGGQYLCIGHSHHRR